MSMVVRVFLVHGGRTLRASVLLCQSHFNLIIFVEPEYNLLFRAKIEKHCMVN